jgi:hypothetical protein
VLLSRSNSPWRRFGVGVTAVVALAGGLPLATTSVASAAPVTINDPPANGHAITSFPDRDFINGLGWPVGGVLTVEDIRGGVVVGTATVTALGPDGHFDLNHAGGDPCWQRVTPDVRAGDVIRVTDANGVADQTTVANVKVTQPAADVGGTIVEKGNAADAAGNQFPTGQIEARIVATSKDPFNVDGKRTLRTTPVYDSPTATTWTATWTGLDQHDRDLAVTSSSRSMWLGRNPGAGVEPTIAESDGFGGPAPGCNAPLAKGPSTPDLAPAGDSGASNTDDITNVAAPAFTGVPGAVGPGATVNLYIDNVLNGTGTVAADSTYSVTPATPLTDGAHSVSASEVDPVSSVETRSTGSLPITIDTLGPALPAVGGVTPASPGASTTPAVTGTAEPGSTVRLFTGATCTTPAGTGTAAAFTSPGIQGSVAPNSTTIFTATATDVAGNVSGCSTTSVTYAHDGAAPPSPTLVSPPVSPSKDKNPSFAFSDTEAGVGFACSMSSGADAFAPCVSPRAYTALVDGSYTFKVRAVDAAGNTSVPTSSPLVIDTGAPVTTVGGPTSPSSINSPSFTFSAEPGSVFSCSMSTGVDAFAPCTSPKAYSGLADGNYTFKATATDPAGNVGPTATRPLVIDTVAPDAVITGHPPNPSATNSTSFDFTSSDVTAKFQCSLTLATSTLDNYQACTSPQAYPARADGNYVFKAKATDPAGNTGTPATYAFTINTLTPAPVVALSPTSLTFAGTPPGTASAAQAVTLSNTGNANLTINNIAIGGTNAGDFSETHATCGATLAAQSSCTINVTFKPTVAGTRTATVSVADNATGSPHTATLSGSGVAAAPGAPTLGTAVAGDAKATVTWTAPASDGGSAVTGYTVRAFTGTPAVQTATAAAGAAARTVDVLGLSNGTSYTFDVVATNGVGTGAPSARSAAVTPTAVPVAGPTVTARAPAVNAVAVGVAANTTATFSEAVTGVSGTTFTLKVAPTGPSVAAVVTYNATTKVATLNPSANLAADTKYTASLTSGIKNAAGGSLAPIEWTFTTGPRPTVTAKTPAAAATAVSRTTAVTATFSENVVGISTTTVTLKKASNSAPVTATVTYNPSTRVVTLVPSTALAASTKYTVNLTNGIKDPAGNNLVALNWSFTTGP